LQRKRLSGCDASMTPEVEKILAGDQLAGARLIRRLEERDPQGIELLKALHPHAGKAFLIGITGPAGAGKSTLTARMIGHLRARGQPVGVVAVDPSSPFSGGALLGDRIRMQGHATDSGVFIRSMAARGHPGGVGRTVREAALVMDAMGYPAVLIETVGAGQGEIEVSRCVHTTVVVNVPGLGDGIQFMKAGLLEIGDVFVVNKADGPGADEMVQLLESAVGRRAGSSAEWRPPVIQTAAIQDQGVDQLVEMLFRHRRHLVSSGRMAERQARNQAYFFRRVVVDMAADLLLRDSAELAAAEQELSRSGLDPYTAAERFLKRRLRP
jgi:LAO/AO transport system kinase